MAAVLIALHVALNQFSFDLQVIKITFASFPIIIAGLMFGPIFGLEVGLTGAFLGQMLEYGLGATTILWIIPVGIRGLLVGLAAKKKNYKLNRSQLTLTIVISSLIVTLLNTIVIYLDSRINGYYSFAYVFGAVPLRILDDVILAVIYVVVIPEILKPLMSLYHYHNGNHHTG